MGEERNKMEVSPLQRMGILRGCFIGPNAAQNVIERTIKRKPCELIEGGVYYEQDDNRDEQRREVLYAGKSIEGEHLFLVRRDSDSNIIVISSPPEYLQVEGRHIIRTPGQNPLFWINPRGGVYGVNAQKVPNSFEHYNDMLNSSPYLHNDGVGTGSIVEDSKGNEFELV